MNYYPFHIGDYASATRHLSWEEDLAYRRLLDLYYTTEEPLPSEPRALYRLVLASTEQQREAVMQVLEEFFIATGEGWVHTRADTEIEAMREKQQKQRDKANKRWHKPSAEPGNASAMPQQAENDAAASIEHADAMPPTPTPTPTPTPIVKSFARGSRLPENFEPDADAATEQGVDYQLESAKFRDYWVAQPGQKGVKTDWPATWRNWCRNAKSSVRIGATGSRQTALEARNRAVIDEYLRETQ